MVTSTNHLSYGYQHKPPFLYTVNTWCEYKVVTYPVSRGRRNGYVSVIFGFICANIHSIFDLRGSTVSRSRSGIRHMILSPLRSDPSPLPFTCDSTFGVGSFDAHCPKLHSVGSNDAAFLPNGPIDAVWVTSARARSQVDFQKEVCYLRPDILT